MSPFVSEEEQEAASIKVLNLMQIKPYQVRRVALRSAPDVVVASKSRTRARVKKRANF